MLHFAQRVTLLALLMLLAGCGVAERLRDPYATAAGIAAAGDLQALRLQGAGLELAAHARGLERPVSLLVVYIEGDGAAWRSRTRPPRDPTPANPLALRLAAADASPAVLHLARPCQYPRTLGCDPVLWTSQRYSTTVLSAYRLILDQLQARAPGRMLALVGWSGGGVLAAMLAAERDDVAWLMTVAAPLDLAGWTAHHGLTPLPVASGARVLRAALAGLPQWHLAGARDRVVPPALLRDFAAGLPASTHVMVLDDFDHTCCWAAAWPSLRQLPEGG